MKQVSAMRPIYSYESARQYLLDYLSHAQKRDPQFSVRKWARLMGLKSHTLLVMLLQGNRPLRVKHAAFLSKGLELGFQEKLYLQALIQMENAEGPEEKHLCAVWLADLNPGQTFVTRELEEFEVISHWVHSAILALCSLKTFARTEKAIVGRLQGRVSAPEVHAAVERLLNLKLLERSGSRLSTTCERLTTKNDVLNRGVRRYHAQVMDLAKDAQESIDLEKREFQAFALTVKRDKLPVAKELIRKFRAQFAQAVGPQGDEDADEVYQMNIQFFQLTERPVDETTEYEGADTDLTRKPRRPESAARV